MNTLHMRSAVSYLLLFALFSAALIALYYNSLSYYWVWEDLHLVHTFSAGELATTFYRTWDLDNVETPGLRPVTVLFNHLRCVLFGESLPAHKIFLIALTSLYFTLICYIGMRFFKLELIIPLTACLLLVVYKYSCIHILWQISGNRVLQQLLLAGTLLCALMYLTIPRGSYGVLSLFCYLMSLLTREDSIVAIPTLFILVTACPINDFSVGDKIRRSAKWMIFIVAVSVVYLLVRKMLIPQAYLVQSMFESRGGAINIIQAMLWAACPFGRLYIGSLNVSMLWFIILAVLLGRALFLVSRGVRIYLFLLAICFAAACIPAAMISKPDILLLPSTLFSLIFALAIIRCAQRSMAGRIVHTIIYLAVLGLAGLSNFAQQQSFHPLSLEQISREYDFLYGEYSNTTVPSVRRLYLSDKFNRLGITKENFDNLALEKVAKRASLLKPLNSKEMFIPRFKSWKY